MSSDHTENSLSGAVLLGIDLQPVFIKAMADGARVLRRCEFAAVVATGLGLPVVFTEQVPGKLGGTAPELLSAAPRARVFGKSAFSALGDETIRAALLDAEHLLIAGLETSVCVYQTALDALAAGVSVTVLSDCVAARRADDAAVCLAALIRAGAHVLPSETVFYALLRDVSHSYFRTFTQCVKTYA